MLLSFQLVWKFVAFWTILAIFTGIANMTFAGGTNVDNLIETGLQPEQVNLDSPVVGGDDPISTNVILPSSSRDWVDFLYESAALQSSVWEGWMGFIRTFFLIGSGVFGLLLLLDGLRTLTGFVR